MGCVRDDDSAKKGRWEALAAHLRAGLDERAAPVYRQAGRRLLHVLQLLQPRRHHSRLIPAFCFQYKMMMFGVLFLEHMFVCVLACV